MLPAVGPISPFRALHWLQRSRAEEDQALMRLASGRRILSGRDDPAGLIAATNLDAAIEALDAESRVLSRLNSNAGIADGHFSQLSSIAGDLQALAVQSANTGAFSEAEIAANQQQVDQIVAGLQRFGNQALESLDTLGLPPDEAAALGERVREAISSLSSLTSGGANSLASGNAAAAQEIILAATSVFAEARGQVGAHQKYQIESRASSLAVEQENLSAARSRIVDADFAQEASNLSRAQVRTAAIIRTLQIVNHNRKTVLALLGS